MIDLNIGGACPRRALTYAFPRALLFPSGPLDAPLPSLGLSVMAVNGSLQECIAMFSGIAAKTGRTWLVANFADDFTDECRGIVQLRPTETGIDVTMVHPFLPKGGAAMILLSACVTRAFAFNARGEIVDVPPPPRSKVSRGIDRGWAELKRRMMASAKGNDLWPHDSWEIRVA
jgi:hypothetical protein